MSAKISYREQDLLLINSQAGKGDLLPRLKMSGHANPRYGAIKNQLFQSSSSLYYTYRDNITTLGDSLSSKLKLN